MLVHREIYIPGFDLELMVSCDLWATVSKVRVDGFTMEETDGDVGPLSWDQSEHPGLNEEIARWLDDNYEMVEEKMWDEYYRECEAYNDSY